jgi:hypothetical protein
MSSVTVWSNGPGNAQGKTEGNEANKDTPLLRRLEPAFVIFASFCLICSGCLYKPRHPFALDNPLLDRFRRPPCESSRCQNPPASERPKLLERERAGKTGLFN